MHTIEDFKTGSVVHIHTLPLFGRFGTVVKVGRRLVHIQEHMTGRVFRLRPDSCRIVEA